MTGLHSITAFIQGELPHSATSRSTQQRIRGASRCRGAATRHHAAPSWHRRAPHRRQLVPPPHRPHSTLLWVHPRRKGRQAEDRAAPTAAAPAACWAERQACPLQPLAAACTRSAPQGNMASCCLLAAAAAPAAEDVAAPHMAARPGGAAAAEGRHQSPEPAAPVDSRGLQQLDRGAAMDCPHAGHCWRLGRHAAGAA
jgi:hypothetical protein